MNRPQYFGKIPFLLTVLGLSLSLPGVLNAQWYSEDRNIMGTATGVKLWHENPEQAKVIASQVFAEFERFDRAYSSYKPESELSQVNRKAAEAPVQISDEFYNLVEQSLHFSDLSHGLFDITYAVVGQDYDYRAGVKPASKQIKKKLKLINYHDVILNQQDKSIAFRKLGMQIDLGGIGKGFVIDRAAILLMQAGVENAVIYAGGDSLYLGQKGDRPWSVGIRHPRQPDTSALKIPMSNTAVSTSGDYERFFIDEKGVRHHHIINPKTGRSPNGIVSATVLGPEATTTDALSTTLMIAGITKALELIETLENIDAVLIDTNGTVHYSSGLGAPSAEYDKLE